MKSIHWLPIPYRIQYKLLLLTHHATHNNKPDYLTELLTNYKSSRPQRTIHKYKLNIPITLSLNKGLNRNPLLIDYHYIIIV